VEVILNLTTLPMTRIMAGNDCAISLNEIWDVRVEPDVLIWIDKREKEYLNVAVSDTPLKLPGLTLVPALGRAMRVENLTGELLPEGGLSFPKGTSLEVLVDLSLVKRPLILRTRKPGDIIQPLGMNAKVRLKKFLHTHKTRAPEIKSQPIVVVADQEEIIWIPGVGVSERVRVQKLPTHKFYWLPLGHDVPPIA
jgi:hypothetical protein